jgi:hypothetical protein
MHFLVSVINDNDELAPPEEMAAIDDFNDRLIADGFWVFAGGLGSTNAAVTLDNRDGSALITDGPFIETKEHIVGFWILDAPDLETALRLAAEGSKACNRKVELRPFLGG